MLLYTSLFVSLISLSSKPYFPFSYLLSYLISSFIRLTFFPSIHELLFSPQLTFFCLASCFALVPLPDPPLAVPTGSFPIISFAFSRLPPMQIIYHLSNYPYLCLQSLSFLIACSREIPRPNLIIHNTLLFAILSHILSAKFAFSSTPLNQV